MNSLEIYNKFDFKFFLCKADKTPDTENGLIDKKQLLSTKQAYEFMTTGRLIGALIPKDIIVIDLNRHNKTINGAKEFKVVKEKYKLKLDIMDQTFVVRTPRHGAHLFFVTSKNFKSGPKGEGIALYKKGEYIIAAGSPGYTCENDYSISFLPDPLTKWLEDWEKKKEIKEIIIKNYIPGVTLKRILKAIKVDNFIQHKRWENFIISIFAACGDSEEIYKIISEWALQNRLLVAGIRSGLEKPIDEQLKKINEKLQSGNRKITIGSFIHFLKEEDISKHFLKEVQGFDKVSITLINAEEKEIKLPFPDPDYKEIAMSSEAKEFFFYQGNTSAASVMEKALKSVVIFVEGEKRNYYFNGSRWVRLSDYYSVLYTILYRIIKIMFSNSKGVKEDIDNMQKSVNCINDRSWKASTISELNLRDGIFNEYIDWDSPAIKETVTLRDGVIDFSNNRLSKRQGNAGEFRRTYFDFTIDEILNAEAPKYFLKFIKEIFPDQETFDTAIFSICLCISGNANKRYFQLWEGSGANGKSTLIEIILEIIGQEKATTYPAELLLIKKFDGGLTPELAKFQGKYAAFGVETDTGKKFSTAIIKNLTGGDYIAANPKYRDPITFKATWQLILAVNDLPDFNADDKAFISRLMIIPFHMKFYKNEDEKQDFLKNGTEKKYIKKIIERDNITKNILEEKPEIIKYLIDKYIELQKDKDGAIPESAQCKLKKNKYIKDNDDMGLFLNDMCIIEDNEDYFTVTEDLANAYREFIGNKKISTQVILRLVNKHDMRVTKTTKRVTIDDKTKQRRGLTNIILKEEYENNELLNEVNNEGEEIDDDKIPI